MDDGSFGGDGDAFFSIDWIDRMLVHPSKMDGFLSFDDQADARASLHPPVEFGNPPDNSGAHGTQRPYPMKVGDVSGTGGANHRIPSRSSES